MDVNLTGALAANVSLMQPRTGMDISAIVSAASVLLGLIVSQGFEWLKRRDNERKEQRKRLFDLRKEAYFELNKVATDFMLSEGQQTKELLPKLEVAANKARIVGSDKVAALVTSNWSNLGDYNFIFSELIPALAEDIQSDL